MTPSFLSRSAAGAILDEGTHQTTDDGQPTADVFGPRGQERDGRFDAGRLELRDTSSNWR